MKSLFIFISLVFVAQFTCAQVGQSGGDGTDGNNGTYPGSNEEMEAVKKEIIKKAEITLIKNNFSNILKKVEGRWRKCTSLQAVSFNNAYELYQQLLYLQMVDVLHVDEIIPKNKVCKQPSEIILKPESKVSCVLQQDELASIKSMLSMTYIEDALLTEGRVPTEDLQDFILFFKELSRGP